MVKDEFLKPDFIIIGAMKCATSTLHDQLNFQNNVHMSSPKEPNFFSDDDVYQKGKQWYSNLFSEDQEVINGESSTHYTKFPTYESTITRMLDYGLQNVKLIYVIRHPVQRLISHYIHEWSQGIYSEDINTAIEKYPELINYSKYNYQISEYLSSFQSNQILIVFYESLTANPDRELARVCDFVGIKGPVAWNYEMSVKNKSSERIRKFPFYSFVIESQLLAWLRRNFIPKWIREKVKDQLVMKERPEITKENRAMLHDVFNSDLEELGEKLGIELNMENYLEIANNHAPKIKELPAY